MQKDHLPPEIRINQFKKDYDVVLKALQDIEQELAQKNPSQRNFFEHSISHITACLNLIINDLALIQYDIHVIQRRETVQSERDQIKIQHIID